MSEFDQRILELRDKGAHDEATTVALRELGPSVFRYLCARIRNQDVASEAFAKFAEDMWRGLRTFEGRSSLRVWAFVIARNAAGQTLRRNRREHKRLRPVDSAIIDQLVQELRTATREYLKSEAKDRFQQLRARLSPDEQALLVLRVNEQLGWDDIARIHSEAENAAIKREAARLRKRFQLVRQKLRDMAREEGLLTSDTANERRP